MKVTKRSVATSLTWMQRGRIQFCLVALLILSKSACALAEEGWRKHEVMKSGPCYTAVSIDANADGLRDVVTSYRGRVSLFVAPSWTEEVVLHRFADEKARCIHSAVLDVDGDGDLDWAGTLAHGHPFWLENPGTKEALQGAWTKRAIDHEITGIHCILRSDIDNASS